MMQNFTGNHCAIGKEYLSIGIRTLITGNSNYLFSPVDKLHAKTSLP
jgi:hypothetical protein